MDPDERLDRAPLAPRWHTALLAGLIVAVAVTGTLITAVGGNPSPDAHGSSRLAVTYVSMLLTQWMLVAYVSTVGRTGSPVRAWLGSLPAGARAPEAALALLLAAAVLLFQSAVDLLLPAPQVPAIADLLPRSVFERAAWMIVAANTAFCEEVVYRGYLRTQLTAFLRSESAGILLQGALFGMAHADQGVLRASCAGLYGILFAVVAARRGRLAAPILGHFLVDALAALPR